MAGLLFTSQEWGNFGFGLGEPEDQVSLRRASLATSIHSERLVFMRQTHSAVIQVVDGTDPIVEADGILTTQRGISLAVLVGDCIPLLLASDSVIGALHVGRVGMQREIVKNALVKMVALGAKEIDAIIGPSICGHCYEVAPDMYQEVVAQIPETATSKDLHCLDLQAGVASQLRSHGKDVVRKVTNVNLCTAENALYFSHRQSQSENRNAGRQVGVITL